MLDMNPVSGSNITQSQFSLPEETVIIRPQRKFPISSWVGVILIVGILYYSYGFIQARRGKQAAVNFICTTNAVQDSLKFLHGVLTQGSVSGQARGDGMVVAESIKMDRGLRGSASYFQKVAGKSKKSQERIAKNIAEAAVKKCPQKADAISAIMVVGMILGSFEK